MYPRSRDPTYPAGSPPTLRVRDRVALALVVLGLPVAYMSLAPGSHPRHAVLLLLVAGVLVGAVLAAAHVGPSLKHALHVAPRPVTGRSRVPVQRCGYSVLDCQLRSDRLVIPG